LIRAIDHLGIAVESLEKGLSLWHERLGVPPSHEETVVDQGVRTAFLPVGPVRLELLEPTGPDTPVGRFLARRGPGFHHVCFLVDDLGAALESLARNGVRLVDERPRPGAGGGRIAFLHPSSTDGLLVELKEAAVSRQPERGSASSRPGPGSLVLAFLHSPKERIWGALREVGADGVWIEGISLESFEDWAREVGRGGEPTLGPSVIFYPMSRVEKLMLDRGAAGQPSLADRFRELAGLTVEQLLGRESGGGA